MRGLSTVPRIQATRVSCEKRRFSYKARRLRAPFGRGLTVVTGSRSLSSGIEQTGPYVIRLKVRQMLHDLFCRQPAGEQFESRTRMRIPRMQGLPPHLPGSIVMRSRSSIFFHHTAFVSDGVRAPGPELKGSYTPAPVVRDVL